MIPSFIYVIEHGQMADDLDLGFGRSREVMGKRRSDSEDRKIAQEKIGRSAVDLQKIGRDLPKIGRSRKRRVSARNAASSLVWAARPPLSYFPLVTPGS